MSQQYLRSLSEQEYRELMQQLYEVQGARCCICNEQIDEEMTDTGIVSLGNRRSFHIEDYGLCHKKCNIGETRDAVFYDSIVNNVAGIAMEVEIPEEIELDNSTCEYLPEDETEDEVEYNGRKWEEIEKETRILANAMYLFFDGREQKAKKNMDKAIALLEKSVAILHPIGSLNEGNVYSEVYSSLIDCYRKVHDKENEIRVLKMAIEKYNSPKFSKMLNKTLGIKSDASLSKESYQFVGAEDWGEKYDSHVRNHLPEFNFYINNFNPFSHYNFERKDMLPVIREIDGHFYGLMSKAKEFEDAELYDNAVLLYEQLLAERCYIHKPYDRLIALYSKAKRKDDVIRVLEAGINYFENRKTSQIEYVRALGAKYNSEKYVEMCISTGKQIRYFCGYIILFDEYKFIDKWKERLKKLA